MGEALRGASLAAVVLSSLVFSACGSSSTPEGAVVSGVQVHDADGMNGAVLTAPYTWEKHTLTDAEDQPFDTRASLEAPLTLVFFGYTMCPDICQAVMADVTSALARLDPAESDRVAMWFVTTDPARDDPATLRAYLDRFDPDFEGLTGPIEDIIAVADPVHVPIAKGRRLPSGGYEVTHGTHILGVMPDGSVPILWTEGTSAESLAEDFDHILAGGVPTPAPDEEQQ